MRLYETAVTPMADMLGDVAEWMDKAAAAGIESAAMAEARFAPDMHPFPRQVRIACDVAVEAGARLAGLTAPALTGGDTFEALQRRCGEARVFLYQLDEDRVDGAAGSTVKLAYENGPSFTFTAEEYAASFALPNFYFHAVTAYGLLRAAGAPLGKADYLGSTARFLDAAPDDAAPDAVAQEEAAPADD